MADSEDAQGPKSPFEKLLEAMGLTKEQFNQLSGKEKDSFLKPVGQALLEDKVERGFRAILDNQDLPQEDKSFLQTLLASRQAGHALSPEDAGRIAEIILANGRSGGESAGEQISL